MADTYFTAAFRVATPILLAIYVALTTKRLRRVIMDRDDERGVSRAFFYALREGRSALAPLVATDFGAMFAVVALLTFIVYDGATRATITLVIVASAFQAVLALAARSYSRATIGTGPTALSYPVINLASGDGSSRAMLYPLIPERRALSRNRSTTRQERAEFVRLGMKQYQRLRADLERHHLGKHVAISVRTGAHITTEDDAELKCFAQSLAPNDFLWMKRVGP